MTAIYGDRHIMLISRPHSSSIGRTYWGAGARRARPLNGGSLGRAAIWSPVSRLRPQYTKRAKWRVPNLNSEQQSGLKYQHWISSGARAETSDGCRCCCA